MIQSDFYFCLNFSDVLVLDIFPRLRLALCCLVSFHSFSFFFFFFSILVSSSGEYSYTTEFDLSYEVRVPGIEHLYIGANDNGFARARVQFVAVDAMSWRLVSTVIIIGNGRARGAHCALLGCCGYTAITITARCMDSVRPYTKFILLFSSRSSSGGGGAAVEKKTKKQTNKRCK